jgi:hypothetical protein
MLSCMVLKKHWLAAAGKGKEGLEFETVRKF